MAAREIYRRKNGKFASKRDLWNGPPTPQHIIDAQRREVIRAFGQRMVEQICAPNMLLAAMRVR